MFGYFSFTFLCVTLVSVLVDIALMHVASLCPNVEVLDADYTDLSNESLFLIASSFPRLRVLLHGKTRDHADTRSQDSGLSYITSSLCHLDALWLRGSNLSSIGLFALHSNIGESLTSLSLTACIQELCFHENLVFPRVVYANFSGYEYCSFCFA